MRKFLALLLLFVFLFGSVLSQHHSGGGNGNENENGNGNVCPTSAPSHSQPTAAPTHHASNPVTEAPTQAPTHHASNPTTAPTQVPTHHASNPTTAPTSAAQTTHHGSNPTTAPTSAPTQHAGSSHTSTQAPSSGSASGGSSTDLCGVTPTSQEPVTIMVPLYVDPGSEWDELITAANGGAKILAIINPDSGPVSSGPDSSYTTYMQKFADAGIEMVGYIHTEYGDRAISEIESEVDTYSSKYPGLKGIFLDEVSADASEVSYYTQAYNYILSKSGYVYDIINPGTQPDEGYLNAATTIVVFESEASQYAGTQFSSWVSCAPSASEKSGYKYKFGAIAYGASQSQLSTLITDMINDGMGYVYVTDGAGGCCTYNDLVSFFSTEASTVQGLN